MPKKGDVLVLEIEIPIDGDRPRTFFEEVDRLVIIALLKKFNGNLSAAQREMGIPQGSLHNRVKRLGLKDELNEIRRVYAEQFRVFLALKKIDELQRYIYSSGVDFPEDFDIPDEHKNAHKRRNNS